MDQNSHILNDRFTKGAEISKASGEADLYSLYDFTLDREIAAKVIKKEEHKKEGRLLQFLEEAKLSCQLEHPNFIPIYDLDIDFKGHLFYTGAPYLLMKNVEHGDFSKYLYSKPIKERTVKDLFFSLNVLLKICDAVSYMHSKGYVHLDIKPGNILLGDFGEVYLIDFGIAKKLSPDHTEPKRLLKKPISDRPTSATWHYMAPEQARGLEDCLNTKTDIFLLGAVLFEIINYRSPYKHKDITDKDMIGLAKNAEVIWPEAVPGMPVSNTLKNIAKKAMSFEQKNRYASVEEFKEALAIFMSAPLGEQTKTYKKGETICREGDQADAAYLIVKGSCRVNQKGEDKIRHIKEGNTFGEIGVLSKQKKRTATVIAATNVTLSVFPKSFFENELGTATSKFIESLSELFIKREKELTLQNDLLKLTTQAVQKNPKTKEIPWHPIAAKLKKKHKVDDDALKEALKAIDLYTLNKKGDILSVKIQ